VLDPAGFSFSFAGRGTALTVSFETMLLGAPAATGGTNLAAHFCSQRL